MNIHASLNEDPIIARILDYWFEDRSDLYRFEPERVERWFKSGSGHDEAITAAFGPDLQRAIRGELDHWAESAEGCLALIILLDQFSRHIYRGTAKAFAQDPKAQLLACQGMDRGLDRLLRPVERVFFYMPLEHAEDLELQEQSVRAFTDLVSSVPPEYREAYLEFLDYAKRHHAVIERFGRFPDLNGILGRSSTPAELELLERPDAMNAYEYLASCRELAQLRTQDGFIDNDTLRVEIQEDSPQAITAWVEFEEVLVEAAGCVADRVICAGRVRLAKDPNGNIVGMEIV
jgi:uncharacterized protein (DUF924 family)